MTYHQNCPSSPEKSKKANLTAHHKNTNLYSSHLSQCKFSFFCEIQLTQAASYFFKMMRIEKKKDRSQLTTWNDNRMSVDDLVKRNEKPSVADKESFFSFADTYSTFQIFEPINWKIPLFDFFSETLLSNKIMTIHIKKRILGNYFSLSTFGSKNFNYIEELYS